MTDAELNLLEHFAKSQGDTITVELIAELRQTQAERDWLATKIPAPFWRDNPDFWFQAAKEAVCQKS